MFFLLVLFFTLSILVSVALILYVTYIGLVWFLNQPFSYKAIINWVGFVIVMALITGFISYFVPQYWQDLMSLVLAHFASMLAFHLLVLQIDSFLKDIRNFDVSKNTVYAIVISMYLLIAFNCSLLITLNGSWEFFAHITQMAIEYFTRTALLMALLLEVYKRRFKNQLITPIYKHTADEYQDYDNQW